MTEQTSAAFFERMYSENSDPWNFRGSAYENSRYAATINALGDRRFRRAVEPGCSVGVLTEKLASIADYVDASDIAPSAVRQAQERCKHLKNVDVKVASLKTLVLPGTFDLLVLSEIGYYFAETELRQISQDAVDKLKSGGILIAVHWLGVSSDHILSGDKVHQLLFGLDGIRHRYCERHRAFRLDCWQRQC